MLGSGGTATISVVSGQTGDDLPFVDLGDCNAYATALSSGDGNIQDHCAICQTVSLRCWGSNAWGQIGVGDTNDQWSPVTPLLQIAITALTAAPTQGTIRISVVSIIYACHIDTQPQPCKPLRQHLSQHGHPRSLPALLRPHRRPIQPQHHLSNPPPSQLKVSTIDYITIALYSSIYERF